MSNRAHKAIKTSLSYDTDDIWNLQIDFIFNSTDIFFRLLRPRGGWRCNRATRSHENERRWRKHEMLAWLTAMITNVTMKKYQVKNISRQNCAHQYWRAFLFFLLFLSIFICSVMGIGEGEARGVGCDSPTTFFRDNGGLSGSGKWAP